MKTGTTIIKELAVVLVSSGRFLIRLTGIIFCCFNKRNSR
jgi:hypothetical protein